MGWEFGGNALPALVSAGFWGMADFCGGMGVRSAGGSARAALRVVLLSHLASLTVLAMILLVLGQAIPSTHFIVWGVMAGLTGGLALACFYVALSRGAMGASAAISGVLAAAVPAIISVFMDGSPGWRRGAGFLIAGAAIWLIAAGARREQSGTIVLAIIAGAGFGLYFVALRFAGPGGVFWSMAEARVGSLTVCGLVLAAMGARGGTAVVTRQAIAWALSTAVLDTTGNVLFIAATRAGRLDVAAVLASLYPASTILLAAAMLRERPTRRQGLGMAVAVGAVILIAG